MKKGRAAADHGEGPRDPDEGVGKTPAGRGRLLEDKGSVAAQDEAPGSVGELLRELAHLRTRVDESVELFSLGVKARIDEIVHCMSQGGAPDGGHILVEPRLVRKMVQRLKSHARRPSRGRVKDLKRIHDLVSVLSEAALSRE